MAWHQFGAKFLLTYCQEYISIKFNLKNTTIFIEENASEN